LFANALAAPVGLGTAFILIRTWGLGGAVVSLILGYAAYAAVLLVSFINETGPRKPA